MAGQLQRQFQTRVYFLVALFLIWVSAIGARLVNLQVFQYVELCEVAKRQHSRVFEISPKRGTIYDRQNRELAVSISVDSVYAVPSEIPDKAATASRLAAILKLNPQDLHRKFNTYRSFTWVKRKAELAEVARVKGLGLAGVYFEKESRRFYPKRELAAHVLGFVGMDNEGMSGLEYAYDKKIRGTAGRVMLLSDAKQRSFSSIEKPPASGDDLILTIDQYIQYVVEQELAAQVKASRALAGTAIVMDPNTGEILAMASVPSFNPNYYAQYPEEAYKNRAILGIYEPGSTFKVFTAATALEEHLASPEDRINCMNGSIAIGNRRIRDHKRYGVLSVREIVAYSSNVGAVQLGFRIGKERFEHYIRTFGFGEPTLVDLPGEAAGLLQPSTQWLPINLGTISMGHGIGVTPLQLVRAVSAIANGGFLPKPHLVMQSRSSLLQKVSYEPEVMPRRVISRQTTVLIKEMLTGVVTAGTGKAAQLEGFSSAGKTGTAQKLDSNGHYSHTRFIASFVGFAPIEKPAIAIVVTIDEPRGQYYGGEVAAPVFKNIAEKTLRYLSVSPDQEVAVAKNHQRTIARASEPDSDEVELFDMDWDVTQASSQEEGKAAPAKAEVIQTMAPSYEVDASDMAGVEVPDFGGKSLRAVISESHRLGLQLQSQGSGLAVQQSPSPRTKVAPGMIISVKFSRQLN